MNPQGHSVDDLVRHLSELEPPADSADDAGRRRRRVVLHMQMRVGHTERGPKRWERWQLRWGVAVAAAVVGFIIGGALVRSWRPPTLAGPPPPAR